MSIKPTPLNQGYTAKFDVVKKSDWFRTIGQFSDANIYQTWEYDAVRNGEENISHFTLLFNDKIIAAAQARLVRIPMTQFGVAYIFWGPLWQLSGEHANPIVFSSALRALRNEYVCHRGLILRIFPILYNDDSQPYVDILSQEGYVPIPEEPGRTFIVDISTPIDELRKRLDQKWRNCLNRSERNNLAVIEGTDDSLFESFIGLYSELLERKKFNEPSDINEFRIIQRTLPSEHKMRIFLCYENGVASAGVICATIGDTGVYLFGATNNHGMTNKGSYLLQWKAIEWMKRNGIRHYNLNGINQLKNPGGYHFKAGLSGKNGRDINYLGKFDCYPGRMTANLMHVADLLLPFTKKTLRKLSKLI